MKTDPFKVSKQSGKVDLSKAASVGNATIPVSKMPFPQRDSIYYQIGPHGDAVQETN